MWCGEVEQRNAFFVTFSLGAGAGGKSRASDLVETKRSETTEGACTNHFEHKHTHTHRHQHHSGFDGEKKNHSDVVLVHVEWVTAKRAIK